MQDLKKAIDKEIRVLTSGLNGTIATLGEQSENVFAIKDVLLALNLMSDKVDVLTAVLQSK